MIVYRKLIPLILFIILFQFNCSDDKNKKNIGPIGPVEKERVMVKGKKQKLPYESYYELDKLEFFAQADDTYNVHVTFRATLAYPEQDHDYEKAIIFKRDLINNLIQTHISQLTYSQLNTADKKERVKDTLLRKINALLKEYPVNNIYIRDFFVMPQRK